MNRLQSRLPGTLLVLCVLSSCSSVTVEAGEHEATAALGDVPDNSWLLIDRGSVTAPADITAYSGGWLDTEANQFCIFGGGHYNYSGNEVWCLDIATLTWHELYRPDVVTRPPYDGGDPGAYANFDNERYPGALFNPDGEAIADARPASRHTYDQLEYVVGHGALLWGGFGWGDVDSDWCTLCADTWYFDYPSVTWKYLYDGSNPSPNTSPGVGASAYSSHDNKLYAKVRQETWTFDPDRNRWSRIRTGGSPPWTIEGTLEYDPVHRNLYFFGGNYETNLELWKFEIERRRWSRVTADGPSPSGYAHNGPGMAYDTRNDVLAVYFGGTVWIYGPSDDSWQAMRPDLRPADGDYVFGRFRYDAVNNGFWLHVLEDGEHSTWFYRYRTP